ncbi:MAG TPA: hexitol phosphatase HxpB [Candidatus Saccharimonadales bacterium]
MIDAVIFDMDGLLIDSEPIWAEAEVKVFNGVGVPLTREMTTQTTGLRTDEVVHHWHRLFPWDSPTQQEVAQHIDELVIELIKEKGEAKQGVAEAIEACESLKLPMAIASSSPDELINTVLEKLGIKDKMQVIHSAHDEAFGKPHPAVYISTAHELGVHPTHCLTFEDSANGVLSAKAARMKCIAIPEPGMRNDKRFGIADIILHSLSDFSVEMLEDW